MSRMGGGAETGGHRRERQADLKVVLELMRGHDTTDTDAPLREDTEYVLRTDEGASISAKFPWSRVSMEDLQAVQTGEASAQALQRVGDALRAFLEPLGWIRLEAEILRAVGKVDAPDAEARITIRCSAGELLRLPLELLTLEPSGQALAQKSGCHVQWEWPGTDTAPRTLAAPPEGGALVFAWSAAGGVLDAAGQLRVIQGTAKAYGHPGRVVQVADASVERLEKALEAVKARGESVAVLHLLCHGGPLEGGGSGYGLWLNGRDGRPELVAPATLSAALEPYAGLVGCVVLCACHGANLDGRPNVMGSVALRLHRARFSAVVAARAPLSGAGARAFSEAFYDALLAGEPLHRAVARGRRRLGVEWAGLQLYARAQDGPQYPVVFRPYRGLQSFEEKDRRFFFGRERLTGELVGRVVEAWKGGRPRFQVVAGSSGNGKSSLVKAGLMPELRKAGWHIALMRPGGDGGREKGLSRLIQALREVRGSPAPDEEASERKVDGSAVMAEARRLRAECAEEPVLLVVDQLEEAFKLEGGEAQEFLGCLWELARDVELRLVVLSTFRADLLEKAEDVVFEDGVTLLGIVYLETHLLYVSRMSSAEVLDAIVQPLETVGLSFEPGVAERLLEEAGKEPGALPLLEHALDAMWQAREWGVLTRAAHEELGGLAGALTRQLDLLWDRLPPGQRRQGQRLMVALVDFADDATLSTRRRGWVEKLRPGGSEAAEAFDAVLEWLVTRRLLVRGQPEEGATSGGWVEIAHEALIRRWTRLQEWLRAGRADEVLLRELEGIAAEWEKRRADGDRGDSYLPAGGKLESLEDLERRVGPLPPTLAGCLSAARRKRRRVKRRTQLAIAALAAGLLTVSGLGVVALKLWRTAELQRDSARRERDKAFSRELTAKAAGQLQEGGDPGLGLALLKQASRLTETEDLFSVLVQWSHHPGRLVLPHADFITKATFSSDRRRVLTASWDKTAKIWNASTGELIATLVGHTSPVTSAAFRPDGLQVVTASADRTAKLWDASTGKLLTTLAGHAEAVSDAAFSPDGSRVVTASADATTKIWDASTGKLLSTLAGHTGIVLSASFSSDGLRIVTACNRNVGIWDASTGKLISTISGHTREVNSATLSNDGLRVVTSSMDKTAKVWDAGTGKLLVALTGHMGPVLGATFSRDGLRIATASGDRTARIWDSISGKLIVTIAGHTDVVRSAEFNTDGHWLVTSSADRTARVWDARSGKPVSLLAGHAAGLMSAAFSKDGRQVVTTATDGTARTWEANPGSLMSTLVGHTDAVLGATLSRDGQRVVTISYDKTAKVWEADTGKLVATLGGHTSVVRSAVFSWDGQRVVTVGEEKTARVWDANTGKLVSTLIGHEGLVEIAAFSRDRRFVATASDDKTARIWNTETGAQISILTGHTGGVNDVAFSRDGQRVATAGDDKVANVWNASTGKLLFTLIGHGAGVTKVVFGRDDRWIATASGDETVRVWDTISGKELRTISGHTDSDRLLSTSFDRLFHATFSEDGDRVAMVSGNFVRVWNVETGGLVSTLGAHTFGSMRVSLSGNGQRIVTTTNAEAMMVWEVETGTLASTIAEQSGEVMNAALDESGRRMVTTSWNRTAKVWEDLAWAPRSRKLEVLNSARDLTPEERHAFLHEPPPAADHN